jgi:hypothetical protein
MLTSELIDETGLDPLGGISEGRKFNAGSLVLVAVVVMGCGGLWFMHSLSKVGAAGTGNGDIEAKIETFISGLNGKAPINASKPTTPLGTGDANVLAVLNGSYTEKQIPLSDVQRNPFIIYDEGPAEAPRDDSSALLKRKQADRRAQFEKAAAKLELKSVLMSSRPLANIGGKIVRQGEEIVSLTDNITFRVDEIFKDSATLVAEDESLSLIVPLKIVLKR